MYQVMIKVINYCCFLDRKTTGMNWILLEIILYFSCLPLISTVNVKLSDLEKDILYASLQNTNQVKLFYDKLLQVGNPNTVNHYDHTAITIIVYVYLVLPDCR